MRVLVLIITLIYTTGAHSTVLQQSDDNSFYSLRLRMPAKVLNVLIDKQRKEFVKLEFVKGTGRLSRRDQSYLRKMSAVSGQPAFYYKVIDLLKTFPTSLKIKTLKNHLNKGGSSTSLCHKYSKEHDGSYVYKGKKYVLSAVVGDSKSKCTGLCGKDCKKGIGKNIYTQECFDHDLCHRKTNSFFGCLGELIRAIPGFFFGEEC